jgi:hypothetical protein
MGEMKRAVAREDQERRNQDRFASTVVIAAASLQPCGSLGTTSVRHPRESMRQFRTVSAWRERSYSE